MANVKVIVISRKLGIRAVILPPGSSTKRHLEKEDYDVVPLTRGTMKVEIFDTARQTTPTRVEIRKLKPFRAYRRKVGRGKYIIATNVSNPNDIIILKLH